LYTTKLSTQG
jgi:hypothetical protein